MEKIQRQFGADIGVWLRTAVAEEGYTRGSLAHSICEFADWLAQREGGALPRLSARPALAADQGLPLPASRPAPNNASELV